MPGYVIELLGMYTYMTHAPWTFTNLVYVCQKCIGILLTLLHLGLFLHIMLPSLAYDTVVVYLF